MRIGVKQHKGHVIKEMVKVHYSFCFCLKKKDNNKPDELKTISLEM